MAFLGSIKPSMQSCSNFCNHKSVVAKGFLVVLGFELGTDAFIKEWIKGWKIELPLGLGMTPMRRAGMLV